MKKHRTTKEDVQSVMKRLRDKEKVAELLHEFYIDSVTATCLKSLEVYGSNTGFDIALDFCKTLLARDMISPSDFLEITISLAVADVTEEGDEHGKE